jgi:hypothetical protein
MGWGGGEHQMGIPMIPAPAAFFAMMMGVTIGVMIGRRKSMMHGMGMGAMHGMGSGMKCGGGWDEWAARKKMMGQMSGHHHHGEGMPACSCGSDVSSAGGPATGE